MNIQWFPGHMTKTMRLIEENIKSVDIVVEILDARIPKSSKNPQIDALIGDKKRMLQVQYTHLLYSARLDLSNSCSMVDIRYLIARRE